MVVRQFPPLSYADENGLLAAGGDLEVETLLLAYRSGIFPWPYADSPHLWWAPPKRAILYLDRLHLSRSMKRIINSNPFNFTLNQDFKGVITGCAKSKRKGGTWLTAEMQRAYTELHLAGYAYSLEARDGDRLAGGIFGVRIGKFVSAESMYYSAPNASKLALRHLCLELGREGIEWIDLQVLNPFTKTIGAEEISRDKYMEMLKTVLAVKV